MGIKAKLPSLFPPLTRGDTENNQTASWRILKPRYRELASPCSRDCPAGLKPERFIRHFSKGEEREAFIEIAKAHPLPSTMGRICFKSCEGECNREHFDGAIAVHSIERTIGDIAIERNFELEGTTKTNSFRAGVIGGGPAGLSFAYHMRRGGAEVTLYDTHSSPGGMLQHVIPEYRLPYRVVEREIGRLMKTGIRFISKEFSRRDIDDAARNFDVLLVATGAWHILHPFGGKKETSAVWDAIPFLEKIKKSPMSIKNKSVVVVGGGNSAIDCARTALRLGGKVDLYYRREERHMPAYREEIDRAYEEGVHFHFLSTLVSPFFDGDTLKSVKMVRTKIIEEQRGRSRGRCVSLEGTGFEIPSDILIIATGGNPSLREEQFEEMGNILFAGDGARNSERTVTSALGSGRKAALKILDNVGLSSLSVPGEAGPLELAGVEKINRDYVHRADRMRESVLSSEERIITFEEVVMTPSLTETVREADRCLSCGSCNGCDNCRIFCPDGAVRLGEKGYFIDDEHCKGCGICWTECPRGALDYEEG